MWIKSSQSPLTRRPTSNPSSPWHFVSGAELTAFLTAHSPTHVAVRKAAGDWAGALIEAIERHASPNGGPVRLDAEYLLVQAVADGT
ncbi:MAG: hypothetical protein ACRDTC_08550 [Pseudonocardiaceae bacterium]